MFGKVEKTKSARPSLPANCSGHVWEDDRESDDFTAWYSGQLQRLYILAQRTVLKSSRPGIQANCSGPFLKIASPQAV